MLYSKTYLYESKSKVQKPNSTLILLLFESDVYMTQALKKQKKTSYKFIEVYE